MKNNDTKETIINSAYALFQESGYDNVTVNDICDECGITKTSFYYHLKSKEEIIAIRYQSEIANQASRLVEVLSAENYWEQLMTVFDQLMDASNEIGPDVFTQIFIMNLKEDRHAFDLNKDLTNMAIVLIERGQEARQIRNLSPAAELYNASCHAFEGYELMWCVKRGDFDRKATVRQAMENIYNVAPKLRSQVQVPHTY